MKISREECEGKLAGYRGLITNGDGAMILFVPSLGLHYRLAFGDGSLPENEADERYGYTDLQAVEEISGEWIPSDEGDGGIYIFNAEETEYDLTMLVYDTLSFCLGDDGDCPDFEPVCILCRLSGSSLRAYEIVGAIVGADDSSAPVNGMISVRLG